MMPPLPSRLPPHSRRPALHAHWDLGEDEAIDQYIEARVAERARAQAARWRFYLVAAESIILALAVLIAGAVLKQPAMMILRGAALVGIGSFMTGALAIVAASAIGRLCARAPAPASARASASAHVSASASARARASASASARSRRRKA